MINQRAAQSNHHNNRRPLASSMTHIIITQILLPFDYLVSTLPSEFFDIDRRPKGVTGRHEAILCRIRDSDNTTMMAGVAWNLELDLADRFSTKHQIEPGIHQTTITKKPLIEQRAIFFHRLCGVLCTLAANTFPPCHGR